MNQVPVFRLLAVVSLCAAFFVVPRTQSRSGEPILTRVKVEQAQAIIQTNSPATLVVLDVRTPAEFAGGRIAGATNIDFNAADFGARLGGLDRNRAYLLHCASGGRSSKALAKMKGLKFLAVYELEGGIKAWEKAGQPVEK